MNISEPGAQSPAIRLFSRPVYKDALFLWTMGVAIFTGLIIGFNDSPTRTTPPIIDGLLAAAFFGFALGVLPALVRLAIRKAVQRRAAATSGPPVVDQPDSERSLASFDLEIASLLKSDPRAVPVDPIQQTSDARGRTPTQPDRPRAAPTPPPANSAPTQPVPADRTEFISPEDFRQILKTAQQQAPYPIAFAARAIAGTRSPREEYQTLLDASEVLTVSLCSYLLAVAAGDGLTLANRNPAMKLLVDGIGKRGASFDSWLSASQALHTQVHPSIQRPIISPEASLSAGTLTGLTNIKNERNRAAHGSRPRSEQDAEARLNGGLRRNFAQTLSDLEFLSRTDWIVVESIALDRQGNWNAEVLQAMGDHPDFTRASVATDGPLINSEIYARGPDNAWIQLGPLIVHRYCEECSRHQMFYCDQIRDGSYLQLRQFMDPHATLDGELVPDFERLVSKLKTELS